jgi:hypothetical protein
MQSNLATWNLTDGSDLYVKVKDLELDIDVMGKYSGKQEGPSDAALQAKHIE